MKNLLMRLLGKKEAGPKNIQELNEVTRLLANTLQNGEKSDIEESFRLYKIAAEEGNDTDSQYNLASMYALGRGTEKNLLLAAYWYKKASDQGNTEAKKRLKKVLPDYVNENIENWTCSELYEQITMYCENYDDEENVFELIESLGVYYCGDKQNYPAAFKCFQAEAIFGKSSEAMYNSGICFNMGRGVENNDLAALYWFDKAADCDNEQAKIHRNGILHAYITNIGVQETKEQLRLLSFWCVHGRNGVMADIDKSLFWLKIAEELKEK